MKTQKRIINFGKGRLLITAFITKLIMQLQSKLEISERVLFFKKASLLYK